MRAPLYVRRVVGASMEPTLHDGSLVIVRGWYRRVQVGDIVVIIHDGIEKIKRVANIDGNALFVLGDNPSASTDSRTFGWLTHTMVTGKVVRNKKS